MSRAPVTGRRERTSFGLFLARTEGGRPISPRSNIVYKGSRDSSGDSHIGRPLENSNALCSLRLASWLRQGCAPAHNTSWVEAEQGGWRPEKR